jgi:predicted PurR-regulated permease PerM
LAVLLIVASIIFSTIFSPCIAWIQRRHIRSWSPGRGAAILIFVAALVAVLAVVAAFAGPPIARDAEGAARDVPQNLQSLQQKVRELPFGSAVAGRLNEISIQHWIQSGLQHGLNILQGLVSGVATLLTLLLVTAYFLLDGQRAFKWAMAMVPGQARDHLARTLERGARRMQRWLYGQLTLMLILGSSSMLVFGLLGVRYFYVLGLFAGVANFVPILGPIATVVVAGTVAALDSWTKVLGVVIFYAVYQQVENAYLTPKIMREAVNLPGVAVIVALTIGGELAGLVGAMIAVPAAALVATIINEYVIRSSSTSPMQTQRAA